MLTEPLVFTGTLSLQDTLDLHRYHFRYVVGWPVRILIAATSLAVATLLIVVVGPSHFTPFIIVVLALCVYFPFGWLLHRRLATWWHYRRHRDQYIEHTATITNASISTSSTRADARLNWDGLKAVVSTSRGLLFIVRHIPYGSGCRNACSTATPKRNRLWHWLESTMCEWSVWPNQTME